ncbi:YugN family protein [Bacillus sp. DX1.1]|uniref:YugN family protein n=1 Tax=unclassified Bacillus (in: firmicutes) TaxID=185979 RepID=UPI00257073AC|nr:MULTISPECIES: YugN family protein [unclassified Bacillus (in: firmicutes)]MDM5156124.1 YugN family protein [Bacillus sp. DX1.1]WJE80410.1 YugN family protein [Bacillus sp. DX3.1]
MQFTNSKLTGAVIDFALLTDVMQNHHFVLAGQWDYERVTYDYKFEILTDVYYLRVRGFAVEGDVGGRHAQIKLIEPLLGKHYYPHGVEYGENEKFPTNVLQKSEQLLQNIEKELTELAIIE